MFCQQAQVTGTGGIQPFLKTILVVEDDAGIGEFLVQALVQETAHHAHLVTDGFQALEIVKENPPDLFILDYHLPRMTGLDLYDQLHRTAGLEAIPAIIMSASLPKHEVAKRQLIGLHKPLELNELLDVVEALLA